MFNVILHPKGDYKGYCQCVVNGSLYNPCGEYTVDALRSLLKLDNQKHLQSVVYVTASLLLLH